MNNTTQLNSELLSADARGRKHIPVAVFAVIIIHIALFLILLIAAGCRSSARAKNSITPVPEAAEQQPSARPAVNPPPAFEHAQQSQPVAETVLVTESATPAQQASAPVSEDRQVTRTTENRPAPIARAAARVKSSAKYYVVKSGDTLDKIARQHGTTIQAVRTANKMKGDMIHPGQKLQLAPEGRTPLQVRSEKSKRSNEA